MNLQLKIARYLRSYSLSVSNRRAWRRSSVMTHVDYKYWTEKLKLRHTSTWRRTNSSSCRASSAPYSTRSTPASILSNCTMKSTWTWNSVGWKLSTCLTHNPKCTNCLTKIKRYLTKIKWIQNKRLATNTLSPFSLMIC